MIADLVTLLRDVLTWYHQGRCYACRWPLAESREKGCVPGDCSFRPSPEDEVRDYKGWRERMENATRVQHFITHPERDSQPTAFTSNPMACVRALSIREEGGAYAVQVYVVSLEEAKALQAHISSLVTAPVETPTPHIVAELRRLAKYYGGYCEATLNDAADLLAERPAQKTSPPTINVGDRNMADTHGDPRIDGLPGARPAKS
jgi:hypothetical protein